MLSYTRPEGEKKHSGGMFAMSKNVKWSEEFGRLEYLPREEYLRGPWVYVGSEDLDGDGDQWDIVRTRDNSDWRYTLI